MALLKASPGFKPQCAYSERVGAAQSLSDARAGLSGRWIEVDRHRLHHAPHVLAAAVVFVGDRAVVGRTRICATMIDWWARAVVVRGLGLELA